MARNRKQRTSSAIAKIIAGACMSLALAGCIGFGIASAAADSSSAASFGLDAARSNASSSQAASLVAAEAVSAHDGSSLSTPASRDISVGIAAIEDEERQAAEKAAAAEAAAIAQAEAAKAAQEAVASGAELAVLSDVDWSVGKEAFVTEWSARIDAYLAGSALAGYGRVFAKAAWENGVDPRWSPAISNTESSKGAHCFKPYNAWGWGNSAWSNWEEAINAHVAGLASGYGYSITYENALKYCPPNARNWFNNTLHQMQMI